MTQAPYHNTESFKRAISALIDRADAQRRGGDLDRLASHVLNSPQEVSNLAGVLFLLDEDFRPLLEQEIEAYRRWLKTKGHAATDQDIFKMLAAAYYSKREGGAS